MLLLHNKSLPVVGELLMWSNRTCSVCISCNLTEAATNDYFLLSIKLIYDMSENSEKWNEKLLFPWAQGNIIITKLLVLSESTPESKEDRENRKYSHLTGWNQWILGIFACFVNQLIVSALNKTQLKHSSDTAAGEPSVNSEIRLKVWRGTFCRRETKVSTGDIQLEATQVFRAEHKRDF